MEVEEIIQEAIDSIKFEFETKAALLITMKSDAEKKQTELDQVEKELKLREDVLNEREARVKEQDVNFGEARAEEQEEDFGGARALSRPETVLDGQQATSDIEENVDVEMTTARVIDHTNYLDVLPIKQHEFNVWDALLKGKKEEMVNVTEL